MAKLTEEQFKLLDRYIERLINYKIEEAFGRDTLDESISLDETKSELKDALVADPASESFIDEILS